MADGSTIEWLARPGTKPATWNPITGCTKISEGCRNCYAERMAKRLAGRFGYPEDEPFRVTWHEDKLEQPLHWKKPRTVFVCSMGDLFHEDVPGSAIREVFQIMALAREHTFIVLTKRPERMLRFFQAMRIKDRIGQDPIAPFQRRALPNVWVGVTAESQQRADERIPLLLQCPAAVRFVSIEPMLGAVDMHASLGLMPWNDGWTSTTGTGSRLDWIICGGESGPGARPMHPDWARSVRDQCQSAGVPFFFKQQGEWGCAGSPEEDRHFSGGYAINDPFQGGRFSVNAKMRANKLANYRYFPENDTVMIRAGKQATGYLLDGEEHREWPREAS